MAREATPAMERLAIAFVTITAECHAVLSLCAQAPAVTAATYGSLLEIAQSKLTHAAGVAATARASAFDEDGEPIPVAGPTGT
jgi:hypothetical protein